MLIEEIANTFPLQNSYVFLSYGFFELWFRSDPRRALCVRAALAAPTYIRPGSTRSRIPHARCEGAGSKVGMGPFSSTAFFSQSKIRSHIRLGCHKLLLSVHSLPLEDGASRHQASFKIAP